MTDNRKIIRNIIIGFVIYSIVLILVGRNLSFIPAIHFGSKPAAQVVNANDIRQNVLEKFLKTEKGTYSIYYKDLKSGESFGVNEHEIETAASVNKMPIVAYLYHLAAQGKIDLESQVTIQQSDIQDYGTGSLRYQDPGGSYSLKNLTNLAMKQSDNTAAYVLDEKLGVDNIQSYVNTLGLAATDMNNNKTSCSDMGKLFELLYDRKITTNALTLELFGFMKDTDFEDRIARYIPKNVSVYHKAGDGVGFVHDVGIIDGGKNPFVLCIMTSDITNVDHAKDVIGKIANFIYAEQ